MYQIYTYIYMHRRTETFMSLLDRLYLHIVLANENIIFLLSAVICFEL